MGFSLAAVVFLLQADSARIQAVVERGADLDPAVRADAAREAVELWAKLDTRTGKTNAVLALTALAGKSDAAELLKTGDRHARVIACDRILPTKEFLPDLLKLLDSRDLGLRMAACRALGRVEDAALRQTISSALGHGMRRTGSTHLLFELVSSLWRGSSSPHRFPINDSDAERAALAVAALCTLPDPVVTEAFAPVLRRALENDKLDRPLRSLLLRVVGRRSPWAVLPLLGIRDQAFRAEVAEVLDRTPTDPLLAPSLLAALRERRDEATSARLDAWVKRHCGDEVTRDTLVGWIRATHRSRVDRQADAAIRRGADALLRKAGNPTAWRNLPGGTVGLAAFTAYALLKCDIAPDDAGVARCLDLLLERDPEGIYASSLAAMALSAAVERNAPRLERLRRRLQRTADVLVDSQLKSGGWSYVARVYPDQSTAGWTYDLSNTQFAILGLRAAANAGAKVPAAAWERARALLEKMQRDDGGWGYQGTQEPSYGRMTAAGATSWILCSLSLDETLAPEAAAATPRIRNALNWLETATDGSQMSGPPDYYLLYSVERLCLASRLDALGSRDWYAEGATILLRSQGPDGSWAGAHGPVADTCMALLFLRKAFVTRPDIATTSARRPATPEQALAVYERQAESLFLEGVREIRPDRDEHTSFILIVAGSEAEAASLRKLLGPAIDGVPLRVTVTDP